MHTLENVIWQALGTRHAQFAESSKSARRFIPEVTSLAGLRQPSPDAYESLAVLLPSQGTTALFLDEPYSKQRGWSLVAGMPLLQMAWKNAELTELASLARQSQDEEDTILELGVTESGEMIALTALTKPGPFNTRTHELGSYFGIRRNGRLVSMAGERLKVPGFTEVSAVCTHPEHTGHGYAAVLMNRVMQGILERGETPFLHVREDNLRAIDLYRRLGFQTHQRVHLAVIRKD